LRDWYFKEGGLFTTEKTRDAYFNFQDGLRIVLQKREEHWPFDNLQIKSTKDPDLTDEEKDDIKRVKEYLRPNEDWTIPEEVIGLVNDTKIGRVEDNVPDSVFDKLQGWVALYVPICRTMF
jgi:hypothetical protein